MKIGILSDTHDRVKHTIRAMMEFRSLGAEVLIHCGDFTGTEVIHACSIFPTYYVFGNNDFDEEVLKSAMQETGGTCLGYAGEIILGGKRIAVAHGDQLKEVRRLREADPDYLLYGHSHVAEDRQDGPTRWINPGALHRGSEPSVAVLDLETDDLRFVKIG